MAEGKAGELAELCGVLRGAGGTRGCVSTSLKYEAERSAAAGYWGRMATKSWESSQALHVGRGLATASVLGLPQSVLSSFRLKE